MKTIHKYPLAIVDKQVVNIPVWYTLLSVQEQNGEVCLWAQVFTTNKPVPVTINMYGTGNPLPENPGQFLGTVLTHGGKLVWHVYCERD